MLCLCAAQLKFWIKLTSDAKIQAVITGREEVAFNFPPWSRIGHALCPIFMFLLVKIWQVSSCGKFMQHLQTCLLYWSWQSFESNCDVFNCLFSRNVQNEIQLLSRVFCYSWLVCLLGFWLRNTSLVKVGNPISAGIVFDFHFAWWVRGLKSMKRYWPYLMAFRSCISNGKPE